MIEVRISPSILWVTLIIFSMAIIAGFMMFGDLEERISNIERIIETHHTLKNRL